MQHNILRPFTIPDGPLAGIIDAGPMPFRAARGRGRRVSPRPFLIGTSTGQRVSFFGHTDNACWSKPDTGLHRYTVCHILQQEQAMEDLAWSEPDQTLTARELFNINSDMQVPAFSQASDYVPTVDVAYRFNEDATLAILAGFTRNRRVLLQGLHGTGKSTHIEQVAARLNWPCIRVNLDGHISRLDLVGKDTIVIRNDRQVTEFQQGIVPWALQRPIALVFDEYDAGRPDVMFVIQRLLERDGNFTLLDQNRVLRPHPWFRLFATANTVGLGNLNGLYQGTRMLNHAQIDRWNIVAKLDYLPREEEREIVLARVPSKNHPRGRRLIDAMISVADLTRQGFAVGDLSTLMSPRTVITWAENCEIFRDPAVAFRLSFLNKCDPAEREIVAEYYQRCFDSDLPEKQADAAG